METHIPTAVARAVKPLLPSKGDRANLYRAMLDQPDPETLRVTVTDGRHATRIMWRANDGETVSEPVSLVPESIVAAVKMAGRDGRILADRTGAISVNGATFPAPGSGEYSEYPDIDRIWPQSPTLAAERIGLAAPLYAVMAAIKELSKGSRSGPYIELCNHGTSNAALVRYEIDDVSLEAVVMPYRLR